MPPGSMIFRLLHTLQACWNSSSTYTKLSEEQPNLLMHWQQEIWWSSEGFTLICCSCLPDLPAHCPYPMICLHSGPTLFSNLKYNVSPAICPRICFSVASSQLCQLYLRHLVFLGYKTDWRRTGDALFQETAVLDCPQIWVNWQRKHIRAEDIYTIFWWLDGRCGSVHWCNSKLEGIGWTAERWGLPVAYDTLSLRTVCWIKFNALSSGICIKL